VVTIPLARGVLAPECLPEEELADCAETALGRDGKTLLSYGPAAGYTPLRELIGQWFGVHPYRVVLTNSGLQGLALLANHVARGRDVVVEYPTYDAALKLLLNSGATLLSAVLDGEGMSAENLQDQLIGDLKPAFVYTIPTFQNPSGQTMPEERRAQVVRTLVRREILLVEDDPYALNRFEGEAVPAIFDYYDRRSIYMSSFSATIAPGLRVGWMILPDDELASALTEAAATTYITPSLLSQAVVHEFISRGSFEPNLRRVNDLLKARRDAMAAALARYLPGASWTLPEGGFFIWLELPGGMDSRQVLKRAEGVTAVAGNEFGSPAYMMRLAFSSVSPEEIEVGIQRLAVACELTAA